ncbi:MAG: class I SAM-dependent methyltransferase [Defluviitaleaceae bacterium]|nr:class I SAM-dependent methyltransferase [Defluviitaleaceae bacterium]
MSNYSGFAYMYDVLMKDVPYDAWACYIDRVLQRHLSESKGHIVVDLACGTGNITFPLAGMGWDMIGVDISVDMLSQAQAKGNGVLFLCQDMRELDLYGTVDGIICACDGFNYILKEAELAALFKRIRMFLNPGGVLIFDMNTEYKFKELLGDKSFVGKGDGASYVWNNSYNPDTGINMYHVEFNPANGRPFEEVHYQRGYSVETICELLKDAGFGTVDVKDGYTDVVPGENCPRVVYIAR